MRGSLSYGNHRLLQYRKAMNSIAVDSIQSRLWHDKVKVQTEEEGKCKM